MSKYDSTGDSSDDYPWRDETFLREQLHENRKSGTELADELGINKCTIHKWCARFGISTEKRPWKDKGRLKELYHGAGMSTREIGDKLGCSGGTVRRWLEKLGIERRTSGEHQTAEQLKDGDWLREQHHTHGRTTGEIADVVGCTPTAVRSALDRHNIERDKPNELSHRARRVLPHETRLRQLYVGEQRTQRSIGELLDCSQQTVADWLSRHGIGPRDPAAMARERTGADHPNWTGGYDINYGGNWKQQRAKALKRDRSVCQRCGMTAAEHREVVGISLDVHHIRPSETFDSHAEANQLDNLVSLCRECHIAVEGLPIDNRQ